jgi:hypothetical protein
LVTILSKLFLFISGKAFLIFSLINCFDLKSGPMPLKSKLAKFIEIFKPRTQKIANKKEIKIN